MEEQPLLTFAPSGLRELLLGIVSAARLGRGPELNHHRLEAGGFGSRLQARLGSAGSLVLTRKSPSSRVMSWVRMYSMIASSVTTPELATKNPRAHR